MSKKPFFTLAGLLCATAAFAQLVDVVSVDAGRFTCRVDGVEVATQHNSEQTATNRADNLKLMNPGATVICDRHQSFVAILTALGEEFVAKANADTLVGTGSGTSYPSSTLLIDEDFSSTPLTNDQNPYYDAGTAFDLAAMPVTGSNSWRYQWEEGDTGTNGLLQFCGFFKDAAGNDAPQSEITVELDFATSSNFGNVNPGGNGTHLIYLRTNLDGDYGDNTTHYVKPDGDGNIWVDLNKSDEPATWQEIRQTVDVDTYDGAVHSIVAHFKSNSAVGVADGVVEVWVDGAKVIDRSNIELFTYNNQYYDKICIGPYIIGGVNNATGVVSFHMDNLAVFGQADASLADVPGQLEFASATYTVSETEGTLDVTVTRNGGADGAIGATVTSANGTATAGSDYTAINEAVSFADGVTSDTVTLTVSDDATVESDETLTLSLSAATGGATIGAVGDTTVTITDDDVGAASSLQVDYPIVSWGRTAIPFTVYNPNAFSITYDYTTADLGSGTGFAEAGTDYTATSGSSVTITAGEKITYNVPISYSGAPTGGRDLIRFSVTDEDTNVTHGRGVILDALYQNDYDIAYPGISAERLGLTRSTDQSTMTNARLRLKGGAIFDTTTAAMGKSSIKHDLRDFDNREFDSGLDSLASTSISKVGDTEDAAEYYYIACMKYESTFDWYTDYPNDSKAQEKHKFGRISLTSSGVYTTVYIEPDSLNIGRSWPEAGARIYMDYDFNPLTNPVVSDWFEIVLYQKRESDFGAGDGILRLYVDGVLEDELLNADFLNTAAADPGAPDDLRMTHMGYFAWTQQQIGSAAGNTNGGAETTGGYLWTDCHAASHYWPSARYDKP